MLESKKLPRRKFQINSLDGLRGLAILLVFLSHTSNEEVYFLPFANLSGVGKSGVFLFFVLSSFLLTLQFIRNLEKGININYLINYFFRRFWRIYPIYILFLSFALITSLTLWKILNWEQPSGIPFILSISEFYQQLILAEGRGVTWSILVEFRYYFILPVIALTYFVIFKNKLFPSAILTTILIIISQVFYPPSESIANDPRLGPYLPIFLIGSLLALTFHQWNQSPLKNNQQVGLALDLLGLIALSILTYLTPAVSSFILGKEVGFDYYHKQFLLYACLWSMVLFSCVAGSGVLRDFFEIGFLRYMGFISFSFYLVHTIVLHPLIFLQIPDISLRPWIILGIVTAISHLSWMLIEKPTSKVRLFQK